MIRKARPAVVLAVAGLSVGACGAGHAVPEPMPQVSVPPPTTRSPAPVETVAGSRNIECAGTEAHALTTVSPAADDLVVGSITWPGVRSWATRNAKDYGDQDTGFYKVGAEVRAGATVTVAVPAGHAGTAGLEYGQGWQFSATDKVTFHACANGDTVYFGGFYLRKPACVPLDISENGQPPIRVTVSFFAGAC